MVQATCKGCTERVVGCHEKCEKYIAYKKKHDEEKEAKTKYDLDKDTRGVRVNRVNVKPNVALFKSRKK